METLAWLVEIAKTSDAQALIKRYATIFQKDLLSKNIEFHTTIDGRRRTRRFVPELNQVGEQDLPPPDLRRYAFKMATGSGKTWVMAMTIPFSSKDRTGVRALHQLSYRRAQRHRVSAA